MGENLYNSAHIATNDTYRNNYDMIDWTKKYSVVYITLISGTNRLHTFTLLRSKYSTEYVKYLMKESGADGYELDWDTISEEEYLKKTKEN